MITNIIIADDFDTFINNCYYFSFSFKRKQQNNFELSSRGIKEDEKNMKIWVVHRRKSYRMTKLQKDVCKLKLKRLELQLTFFSVSSVDLERIEATFRDLTNATNELSYVSFKRDVFANFLPEKLANVCKSLYVFVPIYFFCEFI